MDASDLAPFHPALARCLPRHDVWHLTHSLAFAATAIRARGARRRPMVASVHTDVPVLTRMYTNAVVGRLPSPARSALRRTHVHRLPYLLAQRRQRRILRACDHVLVSNSADHGHVARAAPGVSTSQLRRGIDAATFRPGLADRDWLARTYGVPLDPPTVLFVGRVDITKGAPLVAEAVARMHAAGRPAHLVVAGDGAARPRLARRLGPHVSLLGNVSQVELARVYAACDLLAFPSRSETAGNVVAEAMAAGLPPVLPAGAVTAQWLREPGRDGLLVTDDSADAWAGALTTLTTDPGLRASLGCRRACATSRTHPSWLEVLREDLLPTWAAAHERGRRDVTVAA